MSVLDGKVAIVTGAARGLGRVEALELAKLGARVVVSDLGTAGDGSGRDEGPAQAVVDEIKAAGGEAVAHFGDVADWNDSKAMIQTAVDSFGDLNILVNNAGFCRDKMVFGMSEDEFDSVIRVHVKGHFCGIRHATEYWRNKAKAEGGSVYGRIISTASEAFIFASVGQPNYAAAKAGIVAMTGSAAQGMVKYGVTANTIMPRARTRMNDSGSLAAMFAKPEEGFDNFAPENVSPLVGYLAAPASQNISGNLFVVWGKQISIIQRPLHEADFDTEAGWSYESVDAALTPYYADKEPIKNSFIVPSM
ncbi:MAG: SDR family NAD(P)-dependent oxidoreductase [Deltaproteobacteria bacterium]|nr:SDR family NAD(P)-dependent oxidoreductase [Deltaproteobacteria bacterium]MBW2419312.1 SDR family NAD(P)-dependent oxidoreductase [Deltaproteobacteria bacterium]